MEAMTLEPCPFCGSDKIATVTVANIGYAVCCNGCGASSEVGPPAEMAGSKWNRRAHLAQPAQAVDVGAVRRVIAELEGYCEASEGSCYGTLSTDLVRGYTQQLSGAIQGLGEDGWKLVPLELTPEMAAAASAAVWPVASVEDREKARAAALIVLKTTMDLVPGATLDGLAAGIATMFPAYRAFIAAAPTRALSVQKAGPVVDGWQPIETAPKDGTSVLLAFGGKKQVGGWWNDDRYAKVPRPYWSTDNERIVGIPWLRSNPPIAWMPLPASPTPGKEG